MVERYAAIVIGRQEILFTAPKPLVDKMQLSYPGRNRLVFVPITPQPKGDQKK